MLAWASVTLERPPSPPSSSSEQKWAAVKETRVTFGAFLSSLRPVVTNTTVIGIVLIMGIGIGSFNMLASQLGG